jgi:hypothetical protein
MTNKNKSNRKLGGIPPIHHAALYGTKLAQLAVKGKNYLKLITGKGFSKTIKRGPMLLDDIAAVTIRPRRKNQSRRTRKSKQINNFERIKSTIFLNNDM